MNSYNENLHNDVVASLDSQTLELKKVKSNLKSAAHELYHAEGARITSAEKLKLASATYDFKKMVKTQAVNNSNISTNLLASADQEKAYVAQSVTNAAVCAANVQHAANAIVHLASDMGSIYSIVRAADFDTKICDLSKDAYELMNKTAYKAELTSQHAMEGSALTAEVSAKTVNDMATATNTSVQNILKLVSDEFDQITAKVSKDNATLADDSTKEKAAEGKLEDVNVEFFATLAAYVSTNRELNLNLSVTEISKKGTDYTVNFDYLQNPFFDPHSKKKDSDNQEGFYVPVKQYCIMLVKDKKKSTFSIADAERLLELGRYVDVKPPVFPLIPPVGIQPIIPIQASKKIGISELKDADGDSMALGTNYVVFVLTVFDENYKKKINNFDDYLTAQSATFSLTYHLTGPDPKLPSYMQQPTPPVSAPVEADIIVKEDGEKEDIHLSGKVTISEVGDYASTLTFTTVLDANDDFKVDYRCMFLPDNKDLTKNSLTVEGLRTLESEVKALERIADLYDPGIIANEEKRNDLSIKLQEYPSKEEMNTEITEIKDQLEGSNLDSDEIKHLEKRLKALNKLQEKRTKLQRDLDLTIVGLKNLNDDKEADLGKIMTPVPSKLGFFFNRTIAEKILSDNYTMAVSPPKDETKATDSAAKTEDNPISLIQNWEVPIKADTTDNFGNRLLPDIKYFPVVLTVYKGEEENQDQFTSDLTNYQDITPITLINTKNS